MKTKIITTIFISLLSLTSFAQSSIDLEVLKYKFDSNYPLYVRDGSKFGFDDVEKALDRVYSTGKPVVVFIHGRGNEPNKSLDKATFVEGGAVRKIEEYYNATVLMFNWDSQAFLYDRTKPLSKMKRSADSLAVVLSKMWAYFQARPKLKRPSLIAHSMGSIVVETYVKKYGWFPQANSALFSKIFFTSPDADNLNHWVWLTEIGHNEKVYLSINKNDDILEKSNDERDNGAKPLGLRPVLPYAENITYLDVTSIGGGMHEAFNKSNMKSQVYFCQIFDRIIKGSDPQITTKNTTKTDIPNYYLIKSSVNKKDACFNTAAIAK